MGIRNHLDLSGKAILLYFLYIRSLRFRNMVYVPSLKLSFLKGRERSERVYNSVYSDIDFVWHIEPVYTIWAVLSSSKRDPFRASKLWKLRLPVQSPLAPREVHRRLPSLLRSITRVGPLKAQDQAKTVDDAGR